MTMSGRPGGVLYVTVAEMRVLFVSWGLIAGDIAEEALQKGDRVAFIEDDAERGIAFDAFEIVAAGNLDSEEGAGETGKIVQQSKIFPEFDKVWRNRFIQQDFLHEGAVKAVFDFFNFQDVHLKQTSVEWRVWETPDFWVSSGALVSEYPDQALVTTNSP